MVSEKHADLPVFATDDLHQLAKVNGGDLEGAWRHVTNLKPKTWRGWALKDLMLARVARWLKESADDRANTAAWEARQRARLYGND